MADVRALLKEQQAARRITHPHVTYSTTSRLICLVCNLQLKNESLWTGHQRSPNHQKKLKEAQEPSINAKKPPSDDSDKTFTQETITNPPSLKRSQDEQPLKGSLSPSKKRKAQRDQDDSEVDREEALNKRRRPSTAATAPPKSKHVPTLPGFLPEGFFDAGKEPEAQAEEQQPPKTPAQKKSDVTPPMPAGEFTLASRPLTPMDTTRSASRSGSKPLTPMEVGTPSKNSLSRSSTLATISTAGEDDEPKKEEDKGDVDEDQWAAFEADIAAAEAMPENAVIVAAPVSAEELANMSVEESYLSKRERIEREREQEKEDAINKIIDEREEMKELEARVSKLKARTVEVKKLREQAKGRPMEEVVQGEAKVEEDEEDDDSDLDEDDEDWLRG